MKRILFVLGLALTLLSGCKKDSLDNEVTRTVRDGVYEIYGGPTIIINDKIINSGDRVILNEGDYIFVITDIDGVKPLLMINYIIPSNIKEIPTGRYPGKIGIYFKFRYIDLY